MSPCSRRRVCWGLALDPDYKNNQFLYACYTTSKNGLMVNRVVKLKDLGTSIEEVGIIIDDIPASYNHAGGRIHFGPDGKLYLTAGDALAKEPGSGPQCAEWQDYCDTIRMVPFLRITRSSNSPIYSYGNRNSQGFDWNPVNDLLYETEHGPTGFDGPPGGDEINLIQPGGNYGWPLVSHTRKKMEPFHRWWNSLRRSPRDQACSIGPACSHNSPTAFSLEGWRVQDIYRLVFSKDNPYVITLIDKLNLNVGRVREVVEAPDGSIYFTTSNRDGRGHYGQGMIRCIGSPPNRKAALSHLIELNRPVL